MSSPKSSRVRQSPPPEGALTPTKRRRTDADATSDDNLSSSNDSLQRFSEQSLYLLSPERRRGERMSSPARHQTSPVVTGYQGSGTDLGDSVIESPYTTHKKYGLWGSFENDYNFLMSDEVVETCKSTESDLSLSDDPDEGQSVTFTDFLQLYTELNEWIKHTQAATRRRSNGRVERHLCKSYEHQFGVEKPNYKKLVSLGRRLIRRYPSMREEIGVRIDRITQAWKELEEVIMPLSNGRTGGATQDIHEDLMGVQRWLLSMQQKVSRLALPTNWTEEQRQHKLQLYKVYLDEIQAQHETLTSIQRLLSDPSWTDPDSLNRINQETSRVLDLVHAVWLRCLEYKLLLDDPRNRVLSTTSFESLVSEAGAGDESDTDIIPFHPEEYEKIHSDHEMKFCAEDKVGDVGYSSEDGNNKSPVKRYSYTSAYDTGSTNGSENNVTAGGANGLSLWPGSVAQLVQSAQAVVRESEVNDLHRYPDYNASSSGEEASGEASSGDRRGARKRRGQEAFEPLGPAQSTSVSETALYRLLSPARLGGKSGSQGLEVIDYDESPQQRRRRQLGGSDTSQDWGEELSGSEGVNDPAWDHYQEPAYLLASSGLFLCPEEEQLDGSHLQQEWDLDLDPSCVGRHALARSRPSQYSDSDSDLDDFEYVLSESQKAFNFTEQVVMKVHNDPMQTGVNMDATDYSESVATCRTQVECLQQVVNTLRSEVTHNDLATTGQRQVCSMMSQWRDLEQASVVRLRQSQALSELYRCIVNTRQRLEETNNVLAPRQFHQIGELEENVMQLQRASKELVDMGVELAAVEEGLVHLLNNSEDLNLRHFDQTMQQQRQDHMHIVDRVELVTLWRQRALVTWHAFNTRREEYMRKIREASQLKTNRNKQLALVQECRCILSTLLSWSCDLQSSGCRVSDDLQEAECARLLSMVTTPGRAGSWLRRLCVPLGVLVVLLALVLAATRPHWLAPVSLTPQLRYINGPPPT